MLETSEKVDAVIRLGSWDTPCLTVSEDSVTLMSTACVDSAELLILGGGGIVETVTGGRLG